MANPVTSLASTVPNEHHDLLAEWQQLLREAETEQRLCFSMSRIQELLSQIQTFANAEALEDESFNEKLRQATDAIFEAHLALIKVGQGESDQLCRAAASQHICLALKSLCN